MKEKISVVTFKAQNEFSGTLGDFLDQYFASSAVNFQDDGKEVYVGYILGDFDEADLKKQAKAQNIKLPKFDIEIFEDKNWLIEANVRFEPVETGDFCIYDAGDENLPETKKIPLKIYAKTAFGSTHETTHLCLKALSDVANFGFKAQKVLDVGTGSGILSIASAKKWQKIKPYVLGVDIDSEAVNVAGQNVFDNDVADFVDVVYSDAFKAKTVRQFAPYDLVFANILARPLISMAKKMQKSVKSGGYIILSGFTSEQADWVSEAYQKAGFQKLKLYEKNNWCAMLLKKKESVFDLENRLESDETFLIARGNMFLGEDILDAENKISELSGFSGSAGLMLIGHGFALLFVDGRYTIQAKMEARCGIEVIESQNFLKSAVNFIKTLPFMKVRVNPWAISEYQADYLKKGGINLIFDASAPMSSLLNKDIKAFLLPKKFAGLTSKQKCAAVAAAFGEGIDALLLTSAEEVSWLSNLRARDLPYTPVLRAYGLLTRDGKLSVYSFEKVKKLIKNIKKFKNVAADFSLTPAALIEACQNLKDVHFEALSKLKLEKNEVELKGFINAHIRDGAALVKFLHWLETHYQGLSELEVVEKLHDFRNKEKYYFSESFATIAAVKKNAAIVHYEPNPKTNQKMTQNTVLLLDSGGQYFDGTTDVTRTVGFGRVSSEIKKVFTEILKAHIALADLVFDIGTPASVLDKVCRDVLRAKGMDYKHGTGHSVGHFSNVHEAPFAINAKNITPVMAHYITSIEPGYYLENKYGIRIENLYYTDWTEDKKQLCFKPLTLCPIDLNMIKKDMLSMSEKLWLNVYHQKVFEALAPYLDKAQKAWLKEKCQKI